MSEKTWPSFTVTTEQSEITVTAYRYMIGHVGTLIFTDGWDGPLRAFAPSQWKHVEKVEAQ